MGLLYVFPVSLEETDFVKKNDHEITVKTYGLPYIFWLYAIGILIGIIFIFIGGQGPVLKYIQIGDELDALLGYSLLGFIALLPIVLLGFFFFEKRIIKKSNQITMQYRVFGFTFFSEMFSLAPENAFSVDSFLSTPNVARIKGSEENVGFQNKGYFVLWLNTHDGKRIALDRHSRRSDLIKLQGLLESN